MDEDGVGFGGGGEGVAFELAAEGGEFAGAEVAGGAAEDLRRMNAWWLAKGIPHVRANIEQFRREARRGQIVEMRYADHFLFLASTQDEVVRRTRDFLLRSQFP